MFQSIIQVVIIPVCFGFTIRYLLDRYSPKAAEIGTDVFPVISVAAIVAGVVVANVGNILTAGRFVLVVVVAHNAIGLGSGYGVSRATGMPKDRVRTYAFEVGLQNSGLAAALATTLFEPAAGFIPVLFNVWHNITGPALPSFFSLQDGGQKSVEAMPSDD